MANDIAPGYTLTARTLHWVTAALVLTMIPIGIAMANANFGAAQDTLYHLHRSIGALLIPIVIVRLLYRLGHPAPPLPADVPAIQQFAAHATHWGLYTLLVVQPFVGWIATSAYRAPVLFFWLFEIAADLAGGPRLFRQAVRGASRLGILMALTICAHIGGALFHHFVRKDRVLMRMVTG